MLTVLLLGDREEGKNGVMDSERTGERRGRTGRVPATNVAELTHIGLRLFVERGFDAVTIDEIAAATGIGRRTFFRYFHSKNDLPRGEFDDLVAAMRAHLAAVPDGVPLFAALRDAVLTFNDYPAEELPYHRERMGLLLRVPSLVAHGMLRYAKWRQAIAEFAAERLGQDTGDLAPQMIAWAFLSASLAAYEDWLNNPAADLVAVLGEALDVLGRITEY